MIPLLLILASAGAGQGGQPLMDSDNEIMTDSDNEPLTDNA